MIPLFSPVRQNEPYLPFIEEDWRKIFSSGQYIMGPQVAQFETALAESLHYKHAVACSSGTCALVIALRALELPSGSEVLTSSFSFMASASSVVWAGLTPVFVDVDGATGCVSLETVLSRITPKTRAMIVVDLFGRQHEIDAIRKLCDERNITLIEDGAQSVGVPNRKADIFTTSFYPTKNMGCMGDAGAILTDDPDLAKKIKLICHHGAAIRDSHEVIGTNGRMDTIHAALLFRKLPRLHEWTRRRREISLRYVDAFAPLERSGRLHLPPLPSNPEDCVWALFSMRAPGRRDSAVEHLKSLGVGAGIYYSKPLHNQKSMAEFYKPCPTAERLAGEIFSIPLFPELTESEIDSIIAAVHATFSN